MEELSVHAEVSTRQQDPWCPEEDARGRPGPAVLASLASPPCCRSGCPGRKPTGS